MNTFRGPDASGDSDTGSRFMEAGAWTEFTEEHEQALASDAENEDQIAEKAGE